MREKAQLGIVIVRYGVDRYPNALVELKALLKSVKLKNSPTVIVDNAAEDLEPTFSSDRIKLIGGDNRYWEFSGWQKGVAALLSWKPSINILLLATDAFVKAKDVPSDDYRKLLHAMDSDFCLKNNVVLGLLDPIDYYRRPLSRRRVYRVYDWTFDHWMRTALFYMPTKVYLELLKVGGMPAYKNVNDFCPSQFNGDLFLQSTKLNGEWQNKIRDWLTRDWHSASPLSTERWPLVKQKLLAILNEHTLSCRLRDKGYSLVDLRALRWIDCRVRSTRSNIFLTKKLRLGISLMRLYLPLKDRLLLIKYLYYTNGRHKN